MIRVVAALMICMGIVSAQKVTDTATVMIDGKSERVRKINGRWWAEDNRELTKPTGGGIWWISSKKGESWTFHHHRPLDLSKVEQLHLFEEPGAVESLLGQPNFEAGGRMPGDSILWHYYAEDGTAVFLQFIRNQLAIAKYERKDFGVSGKPVQSVERELAGRNIFKVMADQAAAELPKHGPAAAAARSSATVTTVRNVPYQPDPPQRHISADLAGSIKEGMTRAEVVAALGEPSGGLSIGGSQSDYEDMTYLLESGSEFTLRLEKGKVVRISK